LDVISISFIYYIKNWKKINFCSLPIDFVILYNQLYSFINNFCIILGNWFSSVIINFLSWNFDYVCLCWVLLLGIKYGFNFISHFSFHSKPNKSRNSNIISSQFHFYFFQTKQPKNPTLILLYFPLLNFSLSYFHPPYFFPF